MRAEVTTSTDGSLVNAEGVIHLRYRRTAGCTPVLGRIKRRLVGAKPSGVGLRLPQLDGQGAVMGVYLERRSPTSER